METLGAWLPNVTEADARTKCVGVSCGSLAARRLVLCSRRLRRREWGVEGLEHWFRRLRRLEPTFERKSLPTVGTPAPWLDFQPSGLV